MSRTCFRVLLLTPTAVFAAAPDTGWGTLILYGALLVWGVSTLICGFAGWAATRNTRAPTLYMILIASIPSTALLASGAYEEAKRSVAISLSTRFAETSQSYIDAACKSSLARTTSVENLTAMQLVVLDEPKTFVVPDREAYEGFDRLRMVFSLYGDYQQYLRKIRFQQSMMRSYDGPIAHGLGSSGLEYLEFSDAGRLYGLGRPRYWLSPSTQIDERTRSEVTRFASNSRPDGVVGWYVDRSIATHRIEIADISTLNDRLHWTNRVRARSVNSHSQAEEAVLEVLLPVVFDYIALRTPVRLCAKGGAAVVTDRRFDWLGYVVRELRAK